MASMKSSFIRARVSLGNLIVNHRLGQWILGWAGARESLGCGCGEPMANERHDQQRAMSIFDRIFKRKAVVSLDDPAFGQLTFDHGVWCHNPPGEDFMISVVAPESGPTEDQRECFRRIRAELAGFEERARTFIRTETNEGIDVSILSTYAVVIGDDEETKEGRFTLEMSDPNAWVIHRVEFCGDRPLLYGYDD